ncbi:MAG: Holliday junction resolvase RuvX [Clostridia bacterium]|nr:Holliday junction resolvase RuvX [Clostridia bacterium]
MKYIGVDFGDARVGIASSDLGGIIASAVCILKVKGIDDAVEQTVAKVLELGGQVIVIGLPRTTKGKDEYRVERTQRFAEMVKEKTGMPVMFFDERFTSIEAVRYLSEGGVYGTKRKKVLDAVAAQIILQSYLDSAKREGK